MLYGSRKYYYKNYSTYTYFKVLKSYNNRKYVKDNFVAARKWDNLMLNANKQIGKKR
jgi:hypothetical protein